MKKILLVLLTAGVAFYACKKDDNPGGDNNPPVQQPEEEKPVNAKDPQAMTAAIKVLYGTNTKGALPAPTNSAGGPVLKAPTAGGIAINGGYATIFPDVTTGTVAGYYLLLDGADSYFKIDYTKARNGRKAKPANQHPDGLRELGDYSDSLIVIKLPANASLDTFRITYMAYDSLNHTSNKVSTFITILPAGPGTDGQLLVGTWSANREKGSDGSWGPVIDFSKTDTLKTPYTCYGDSLAYCYDCKDSIATSIFGRRKQEIAFTAAGRFGVSVADENKHLDWQHSTCANLVYFDDSSDTLEPGVWSYDANAKKITFIYDAVGGVLEEWDIVVKDVDELTATKLVLTHNDGQSTMEYIKK